LPPRLDAARLTLGRGGRGTRRGDGEGGESWGGGREREGDKEGTAAKSNQRPAAPATKSRQPTVKGTTTDYYLRPLPTTNRQLQTTYSALRPAITNTYLQLATTTNDHTRPDRPARPQTSSTNHMQAPTPPQAGRRNKRKGKRQGAAPSGTEPERGRKQTHTHTNTNARTRGAGKDEDKEKKRAAKRRPRTQEQTRPQDTHGRGKAGAKRDTIHKEKGTKQPAKR
jgi:hypothetical protein